MKRTHLELMQIDDKGLQSIWQHHPHLMSLILKCNDCTDFGFTGFRLDDENANQATGYSIQKLNRLKYLDLTFSENCSKITERSFAEFTFPDLFGLKLCFCR